MDERDVIMRMCGAYIGALNSQPEDCRDGGQAMLAAVHVLWDELADENMWEAADWLRDSVIKPRGPGLQMIRDRHLAAMGAIKS